MSEIKSYRDLDVWQRSVDICVKIYQVSDKFPASEQYGLTSQLRRSAVSLASNIAEGHSRSTGEFARFLLIARGSLSELETQIEIAKRIGYLSQELADDLAIDHQIIGRQLNALLQKIKD